MIPFLKPTSDTLKRGHQTPFDAALLMPGDCMLYRPSDIFDFAVALKTWTWVSHVECFVGNGRSVASRNGQGVNNYPVRLDHVACVLRPPREFDLARAMEYFESVRGDKYGWRILLSFALLNGRPIPKHQICSQFASNFYDAGRFPLYGPIWPTYRAAPATVMTSRVFGVVWQDAKLFKDL